MLENIKLNEKYTLVIENDFGMIVSRQVKINEATEVKKSQYSYGDEKALKLIYTLKGKRSKTGTRFSDNKIAIIEGWKEVKGAVNNDSFTEMVAFDENNFDNILKLNNLNPVVKYNC
jgi:hypothetical protein